MFVVMCCPDQLHRYIPMFVVILLTSICHNVVFICKDLGKESVLSYEAPVVNYFNIYNKLQLTINTYTTFFIIG